LLWPGLNTQSQSGYPLPRTSCTRNAGHKSHRAIYEWAVVVEAHVG